MIYQFDTNILLHYVRESDTTRKIEREFQPFDGANEIWVSVVSIGEIKSIALQSKWGKPRLQQLTTLLTLLAPVNIWSEDILDRYAEIDAYSQGKLPNRPLPFSARNMGKNDLWIAACASILGATLLTTDADFNHLHDIFLPVVQVVA